MLAEEQAREALMQWNISRIRQTLMSARRGEGLSCEQVALRAGVATITYRRLEGALPSSRLSTLLRVLPVLEIDELSLTGRKNQ
ncbi:MULTISPECIES: hypothetical protein [Bacteria]|uniref:helix-turn-helix domain-containing protein n=1 Tax=Bacteria TaxID=2 RepID=UPI0018CEB113|nr:hypothetical protein [Bacillus toyonensis]